jgi:hypothetical protein
MEQGPESRHLSPELLIRTQKKMRKDENGNVSTTEGGYGPKNSTLIGFEGQVIKRMRIWIDDFRRDLSKVISHIRNS